MPIPGDGSLAAILDPLRVTRRGRVPRHPWHGDASTCRACAARGSRLGRSGAYLHGAGGDVDQPIDGDAGDRLAPARPRHLHLVKQGATLAPPDASAGVHQSERLSAVLCSITTPTPFRPAWALILCFLCFLGDSLMTHIPKPNPCYLDGMTRLVRSGSSRWVSPDGDRLFEWDGLHGEIEMYNRRGKHLGALHALTGQLVKPAQRGRTIDV